MGSRAFGLRFFQESKTLEANSLQEAGAGQEEAPVLCRVGKGGLH